MSDPRADNTSATGGFLLPSSVPGHDAALDALQALVAGVTGLPSDLVRPRWQPEPPREPKPSENWCAFGVTGYEPQNFPEIRHHGGGEGHDEIVDQEVLTVLMSFYGPGHMDMARLMRRGVHVPQHRAMLRPAGLAFIRAGTITAVPALVAMQWRARADLPLTFRLTTHSRANILHLKRCGGCGSFIETDTGAIASLDECKE